MEWSPPQRTWSPASRGTAFRTPCSASPPHKRRGGRPAASPPPLATEAAGGTAAVAVASREQDPLYGNIIEITYFGNPAEAEAYLDPSLLQTVSTHRERPRGKADHRLP